MAVMRKSGVFSILSCRTKNPILIANPNGKTQGMRSFYRRIVRGDVLKIQNQTFFLLGAIAGAKYKGEFRTTESCGMKWNLMMKSSFIDEIHTLVGAGKRRCKDAANILKPALARASCAIGATTFNEQKYFEKDKALERRFQIVRVDEPDALSAISILRGIKERYENHHKVRIKDDAIISAVELSQRYISDRFLPDKAIDLMDEAAAKLRLEMDSVPEELDEVERRIKQLEIEREAIKREKDDKKLATLGQEISNLKEEQSQLRAKWESEKAIVDSIQKKKAEIEDYRFEAEEAERQGRYDRVAELRYGKIKDAENEIEKFQAELETMKQGDSLIKEEVDAEDIAEVVARWTGIPVTKMLQSEREKLLQWRRAAKRVSLSSDFCRRMPRRSRAGLQDETSYRAFIFLGSTGVGKTELAKALAEYLFNDENMITRIDMSEYQEKFSVTRLIGSPPGYVGYEEGGQLTEAVRHKPYSVVLFDEIEKAHPDVFNVLLQVLDDGRLTDNKGRTVNFKNTIIIMTSNLGSHLIRDSFELLDSHNTDEVMAETREKLLDLLRKTIRPEFLNRIDETIVFTPLSRENITQIVKLQFNQVVRRLSGTDVKISLTDKAVDRLAAMSYDPHFGARPVKRVLQRNVLNELSRRILAGQVDKHEPIVIDVENNELVFRN